MAPPKGFIPWNKGLKGIHLSPSTEFKKGQHISRKTEFKKGHKPANPIKKGERRGIQFEFKKGQTTGRKNINWRGSKVGYGASHSWMVRKYGRASKCENKVKNILGFPCKKKSKNFDWAFIDQKGFRRDRESYMELCHSCHLKYDKNR